MSVPIHTFLHITDRHATILFENSVVHKIKPYNREPVVGTFSTKPELDGCHARVKYFLQTLT